jgi:hypothetical protein
VRYWSQRDLRQLFEVAIGMTSFQVDCFFGLGQYSDRNYYDFVSNIAVRCSEGLKKLSRLVPPLTGVADSILASSVKR